MAGMRMYAELARWWPLLSPPADYEEEAAFFLGLLREGGRAPRALLELGCGGGSLAWHLKRHAALTLVDLSADMLSVCRATNPECEALEGDMRRVRLDRVFDAVLVHDAIMYATTEADLAATIDTAACHCAPGGLVILAPDCTKETFEPETGHGGADGGGRRLRYVEWMWDPDPEDDTFETAYTFYLRDTDGQTRIEEDRHREGLFPEATWLRLMEAAGLDARAVADPWRERIFTGRRRA
jgi:SAM-dependent methyltransferase